MICPTLFVFRRGGIRFPQGPGKRIQSCFRRFFSPVFKSFPHVFQLFGKRPFRMERAEEVILLRRLLLVTADGCFHVFKSDDHIVFLSKFFQFRRKLHGMRDVHSKHAEKQPDHK